LPTRNLTRNDVDGSVHAMIFAVSLQAVL